MLQKKRMNKKASSPRGGSGKQKRVKCIYCKGKNIVKRGKQKSNSRAKQIYYCKDCKKRFVFSSLKGKSFDARVVWNAISYYNLGNTLEQSSKLVVSCICMLLSFRLELELLWRSLDVPSLMLIIILSLRL